MIRLTRLNGAPLHINIDLILSIESTPDAVLTLVTGEKLVVKETAEQVVRRFHARRRKLFRSTALTYKPVEVEA